jgi:hypothetical protein
MKTIKRKNDFDCLAFKERAQKRILKETKGMTWEEEVQYLHERALNGPFAEAAGRRASVQPVGVREKGRPYRNRQRKISK